MMIREKVWSTMETRGIARFPLPLHHRIPNFVGAEIAAKRLASMDIFRHSKVIKVNPDSPQAPVRKLALMMGKTLIVPTPRLRRGFLLLNPSKIPRSQMDFASTIRGSFIYGESIDPWSMPKVDLVVVGSVAVGLDGARLGKGGGYAELEYAILREFDRVSESTPIVTTVHDVQVFNEGEIPHEPHDLVVDYIITPSRVIEVKRRYSKPTGILWNLITEKHFTEIPLLKEIARRKGIAK